MKIGIIAGEYPPLQGGVGAYTQILARRFASRGHQVSLLVDHRAQESTSSISLTRVDHWDIKSLGALKGWIRAERPDVINLQFQTAAFGMSPFVHFFPSRTRPTPFVTTFHDLRFPYLFPKAGPLRTWIVKHLARTSSGVIVTNHEDAESLKALPNVALIPIGSNITLQGARPWFNTTRPFTIGYFGFINRSKGVDRLLEALALARQKGCDWRLVMIGGQTGSSDPTNAEYLLEIEQLIERLNINDAITWTGFLDDAAVSQYLSEADAIALPFQDGASYRRGSLMAAIQHGCAIVTTPPTISVPTFRDGQNMLFAPATAEGLFQALSRLESDQTLRHQIQSGAKALAGTFDWDAIADAYLAMFQRVTTR